MPAVTISDWMSWIWLDTSDSVLSTSDSDDFAFVRLVPNCVFIDCDCVSSSAFAEPIGSSAADSMRLFVDSCICVLAIWPCSVLSCVVPAW